MVLTEGKNCWDTIVFQTRKSIKEGKTLEKVGDHLFRVLVARIMFVSKNEKLM